MRPHRSMTFPNRRRRLAQGRPSPKYSLVRALLVCTPCAELMAPRSKLFRNCGFEAVLVKNLDSPPPKLRCRFQRLGEEEDELQSEPGLLVELNRKLDASRALPPALSVAMAMADGHRA